MGAFVIGIVFLDEAISASRLIPAGLIVSGLLLMKLSSPAKHVEVRGASMVGFAGKWLFRLYSETAFRRLSVIESEKA